MFGKKDGEQPDYDYFAIYDSKAQLYNNPMLAINPHDMMRQIHDLMSDPGQQRNAFVLNAEDFALYKIGSYSKRTGKITGCEPQHVANLFEIRAAIKNKGEPTYTISEIRELAARLSGGPGGIAST